MSSFPTVPIGVPGMRGTIEAPATRGPLNPQFLMVYGFQRLPTDPGTDVLTVAAQVSLVGAEIRIYDLDNSPAGSLGTELAGVESCPTSTFQYYGVAGNLVWVQVMLSGYKEFGQEFVIPQLAGTLPAVLRVDSSA